MKMVQKALWDLVYSFVALCVITLITITQSFAKIITKLHKDENICFYTFGIPLKE